MEAQLTRTSVKPSCLCGRFLRVITVLRMKIIKLPGITRKTWVFWQIFQFIRSSKFLSKSTKALKSFSTETTTGSLKKSLATKSKWALDFILDGPLKAPLVLPIKLTLHISALMSTWPQDFKLPQNSSELISWSVKVSMMCWLRKCRDSVETLIELLSRVATSQFAFTQLTWILITWLPHKTK